MDRWGWRFCGFSSFMYGSLLVFVAGGGPILWNQSVSDTEKEVMESGGGGKVLER